MQAYAISRIMSRINDVNEYSFYPLLRDLAELPDADTETLESLSEYIFWMNQNGNQLKFVLSESEQARAAVTAGGKLYYQNGANEFLNVVPTYELVLQLVDFIDILTNQVDWKDAPTFSWYATVSELEAFPKYILYSGLDVHVDALLRVIDEEKYRYT